LSDTEPLTLRSSRFLSAAIASILLLLAGRGLSSQAPSGSQLTILSKEGRRALPTLSVNDQEFVALDDLASAFQLAVREETLGNITVSYRGKTIVLTPDQALASVGGRLVSLPAPPTRNGRRWLVPVEFVNRALGLIYDQRLELRKPSHLLIVGDLRVPRITARYEPLGTSSARLTIDAAPRASSTVSQDNERVTVRFDADAIDAGTPLLPPLPPGSLVQGARVVDPLTIAVELAPRTTFRATAQPTDTAARLMIDVAASQTTEQQPASPATPAPAPPELPPSLAAPQAPGLRTLVIDPGHGGEDEGVRGARGTKEKDVTLAAARRIKAAIEGRLGIRVLLTRDDDRNVSLDDRSAYANNNKADLFISLHANASFRKTTGGLKVFTAFFGDENASSTSAVLKPERVPAFGGGLRDIELVPWDLAQIRHLDRSAIFAKTLQQLLAQGHVPLAAQALDQAPLRVLEAANMPAVLIELGYLSNPDQETQIAGNEFQSAFIQAVLEAVVRLRDVQTNGGAQ
jgi:N-acetylmuramoyl-L-alanine amidase